MKLTREQELYLIQVGLETILNDKFSPNTETAFTSPKVKRTKKVTKAKKGKKGKKWTPEHRAKFLASMKDKRMSEQMAKYVTKKQEPELTITPEELAEVKPE